MFTLSNIAHRNTITEADNFITPITKKLMPKSHKMRYYCQVLVDLNKCKRKHYGLISTVGRHMKNRWA